MSRLRQMEQQAFGVQNGGRSPGSPGRDSGYESDGEDDIAGGRDTQALLGRDTHVHLNSASRDLLENHSRPLVNGRAPAPPRPYVAQPTTSSYQPRNQAHLLKSSTGKVRVDPNCKGTLDYPAMPSEWGCCCCCSESLPPCFYKRKIGAAYLCCERTTRTGEPRVICMLGAGWSFSLVTYGLIYGTSGLTFLACWSSLPPLIAGLYLCVWTFGCMSLACTGCGDPGIFLRYERPKAADWRFVAKTNSYRPPGVMYCSESHFLVEDLDHFCPWTGTTIAKKNMCCFQTFLAMIMVTLISTLIMVGAASTHSGNWASSRNRRSGPALRANREHAKITNMPGHVVCGVSTWFKVGRSSGNGVLDLQCQDKTQSFAEVTFADWGTSKGGCTGEVEVDTACSDVDKAVAWVTAQCVGKKRCKLQPTQAALGDPCAGKHKRLITRLRCE